MRGLLQLETWIAQLVEDPFVRMFAGRLLPQEVAGRLVRALEEAERLGVDGVREIPGRYVIALNPEDLMALHIHHPELETRLAEALKTLALRMELRFKDPPAILLHPDSTLPLHAMQIKAAQSFPLTTERTRDLDIVQLEALLEQPAAGPRAYFVVQGEHTFDLSQSIVRIGRALDNDLILEDRRVSRYHAQLRCRYHRYILQDLGSSGGTHVNGFLVQEVVLRAGDLISLAGVSLLYAEGDSEPRASSATQDYPAQGG